MIEQNINKILYLRIVSKRFIRFAQMICTLYKMVHGQELCYGIRVQPINKSIPLLSFKLFSKSNFPRNQFSETDFNEDMFLNYTTQIKIPQFQSLPRNIDSWRIVCVMCG